MEIATVTSKGQITIPASIRKALKLEKGSKVIFDENDGNVIMINASNRHLDMSKLSFASQTISTEDALSEENPFEWSDEIVKGEKKIKI